MSNERDTHPEPDPRELRGASEYSMASALPDEHAEAKGVPAARRPEDAEGEDDDLTVQPDELGRKYLEEAVGEVAPEEEAAEVPREGTGERPTASTGERFTREQDGTEAPRRDPLVGGD